MKSNTISSKSSNGSSNETLNEVQSAGKDTLSSKYSKSVSNYNNRIWGYMVDEDFKNFE